MEKNEPAWVVIIGNLYLGVQTVHGPFESKNHANQWANLNLTTSLSHQHIIVPVEPAEPI